MIEFKFKLIRPNRNSGDLWQFFLFQNSLVNEYYSIADKKQCQTAALNASHTINGIFGHRHLGNGLKKCNLSNWIANRKKQLFHFAFSRMQDDEIVSKSIGSHHFQFIAIKMR